jgi:hypothetical protein
METIRLNKIVEKDGEISVSGLPCKKGQQVEITLVIEPSGASNRPQMVARQLRDSELIGIWKDREDLGDSTAFARKLREQAQIR